MNRKKINNMILALGTAAALSFGGNMQVKASEGNKGHIASYERSFRSVTVDKSQIQKAIDNINSGNGTINDYNVLDINGVTLDNYQDLNAAVRNAIEKKGSNLNRAEIKNVADEVFLVIEFLSSVKDGTVSVDSYMDFGLEGVNENNISEVNYLLKDKKYYSVEGLENYISKVVTSLNNINEGNCDAQDYKNIEIKADVTESNINIVNKSVKEVHKNKGTNLTIKEIEEAALNGIKNYENFEKINSGEAGLDVYNKLNIYSVGSENLLFINRNMKGSDLWNVSAIQEKVDKLAALFDKYDKINKGTASVDDYDFVGVSGVTSEIVKYVNADLKGKELFILDELKSYVIKNNESYIALSRVNNGTASLEDYRTLKCDTLVSSNVDFVNNKIKGKDKLKAEDVQEEVKELLEIKQSIEKIKNGQAILADYNKVKAIGVTESNLEYINKALKGQVNDYGTNIQILINNILSSYNVVNNINEGKEVKNGDGFVKEYKELLNLDIAYDTTEGSEFSIIRNCISIKRKIVGSRQLTTGEISDIINAVHSNLEDSRVLLNKINEELEKTEALAERELTAEEEKNLIDDVISRVKYAVRRIYVGAAKVDDFKLFGENRVNEYNIAVVNKDIESFREIRKLSAYRLSGIEEEVSKALAVYNINRDNLNKDSNNLVKEFALLGKEIPYNYENGSVLRITEDLIIIRKKENGGETLNRTEILNVLEEVENNLPKYRVLIPKIADKIFLEENSKNRDLTKDEVNEIVNNVEEETKDVVSRLVLGQGRVEDYILYGENRVNSDNLSVINDYIKVYGEVSKKSNYDVDGLKEAVDKGIAIYSLNNGLETAGLDGKVQELETIGVMVDSSNDSNSIDKKIMRKIKEKRASENNRYLNKDDILKIVAEAKTPEAKVEPSKPEEPKKKPGFFDAIKDWFKHIFRF